MKHLLFISALSFGTSVSVGQDFQDKNLQALVDAERAFAASAREHNTRHAFLTWLADDAIMFSPEGPTLGKTQWEARPVNESLLSWYPTFAEIAASGDFGFDFGPWQFSQLKTDTKPVAFGHFVTVWKIQADGKWKVAADIGISHDSRTESSDVLTTKMKSETEYESDKLKESFLPEESFMAQFKTTNIKAYQGVLSEEAKLFRNGKYPAVMSEEIQTLLKENAITDFTMKGFGIASSGDMAFAYGTATINTTTDGKEEKRTAGYLRIWKKENGNDWKLVLDIVS